MLTYAVPGYRKSLAERLNDKFIVAENGCWNWTGSKNSRGYGRIGLGTRRQGVALAYVAMYELTAGPVPDGLELDHLCRNTSCVNPDHLEPVTHQVNMSRGYYATKEECPKGHPYDAENTYTGPAGDRRCRTCARELDKTRLSGWERQRRAACTN